MTERSVTHASFTLERVYPARPARVFKAFADPDAKRRWFSGPPDWEQTSAGMDFRVGGAEHSYGGPKGGPNIRFDAIYQDIVPDERIVYAYNMHMDDACISASLATIELRPEGDGTRLKLTEQGAFLDGFDNGTQREAGTRDLLDAIGRVLEDRSW